MTELILLVVLLAGSMAVVAVANSLVRVVIGAGVTELGVVGPFARASGVDYDMRKIHPYDAYGEVDFEVVTKKAGDAWARTLARWREIYVSMSIVEQLLKNLLGSDVIDEALLFKKS